MSVLDTLLALPDATRAAVVAQLTPTERTALAQRLDGGARFGRYRADPVGFVTEVLHETIWSKQQQILISVHRNKRTAVPAGHAPGKSHLAARAVAWWVSVHPPGTALVVTTATTFRQVRNILWPHIRRVAKRHDLPGDVLTVEWKVEGELAAYGFSAADTDEAAVQGIHAPNLLIVVDEAGGISHTLGQALEALMTGSNTRLLVIGNPATDQEGSWFEKCCGSALYNVIRIGAHDTPNFTGEDAGVCAACPPLVPAHPVSDHLVDTEWVNDVIEEFGEDSAFVEARVHAHFPRNTATKVIPLLWAEEAMCNDRADASREVSLGVDVASDGGDELVVARIDGWAASIRHKSSGAANTNAVHVTGVILEHILEAEALHAERGITKPVRVKIDSIGLGWGVVSLLEVWGQEGRHHAKIIGVNVAESAGDTKKYANQRAEMWWNGRLLLQPDKATGRQRARLDIDRRTLAQLAAPKWTNDSSGRIVIQKKSEIKKEGGRSPDRAEAILLGLYEPPGRAEIPIVVPLGIGQENPWRPH